MPPGCINRPPPHTFTARPSPTPLLLLSTLLALAIHSQRASAHGSPDPLPEHPRLLDLENQKPELVENFKPWWELTHRGPHVKTRTPRLHLVTFCTYPERCHHLMASARKYRLPLLVYTAMPTAHLWQSKAVTIWKASGHLSRRHPHDVMMYVDGLDVELFCSEETLLRRFFAMRSPLVIGAEVLPWPDGPMLQAAYSNDSQWPTRFNKVQAGQFIGMAHAVHAMMSTFRQGRGPTGDPIWNCTDAEGVYHKWFDDQRCMHTFFLHNSHAAVLDYYYNMFFTKVEVPDDHLRWDAARNAYHFTETGSHPCVLHFPGNTEKQLPHLSRALTPLDTTLPEFQRLAEMPVDGVDGVPYVHLVHKVGAYMAHPMIVASKTRYGHSPNGTRTAPENGISSHLG